MARRRSGRVLEVFLRYVQFGRMIFEGERMKLVLVFNSSVVKAVEDEWR